MQHTPSTKSSSTQRRTFFVPTYLADSQRNLVLRVDEEKCMLEINNHEQRNLVIHDQEKYMQQYMQRNI